MSLQSQFKMDAAKESEGIEIKYAANDDGTVPTFRVLRRSSQNQRYVKVLERETAPYRRLIELGALDKKKEENVLRRVFCQSVLIGWQNVQKQSGENILYTFENAMQLFEELPELYLDLAEQAGKLAAFRVETQESDAKN